MEKTDIQDMITTLIELNPVSVVARGQTIVMGRNSNSAMLEFVPAGAKIAAGLTLLTTELEPTDLVGEYSGPWQTGEEVTVPGESTPYYITSLQRGDMDAFAILSCSQMQPET